MKTTRDLTPNTLLPIKIVLWILSIVTLVTAVFFTYEYLNYKKNIYISEKIRLEHLNKNAIDKIEAIVKESMKAADKLANRLTKDKIPKSKMRQTLARMIKSDKHIYGGTITFAPYGYDKNKRLHSDYYSKSGKNGALEYLLLSDLYDYTTADYDWYIEPMQKGNRWGEPYWDEAGRTFMITYSSVFYKKDSQTGKKVPNGVITVDISLEEMKNIIESLNLGNGGFGTLTTKTGRYIYHPNYEYIRLQKNVTEIATEAKDENMLEAIDIMSKNREGVIDYTNPTTKQKSWLFYNSINAGWSLQTTFFLDDLYIDTTTMRQQLIKTITMALFMMITLSVLYILHTLPLTHRKVWFFPFVISIPLLIGIGTIWSEALLFDSSNENHSIRISNHTSLTNLKNQINKKSAEKFQKPPLYIPTGIYIESLEIIEHKDLSVVGRLWQKYPKKMPDDQIGFQFANAKESESKKIDTRVVGKYKVVNWEFKAQLNVQLDLSKYPLEVNRLRMKIEPSQLKQNIVLIPDLDSYKLRIATLLPGLAPNLSLQGWKFIESVFTLNKEENMVNFGIEQNFDQETRPSLSFEIGIKRMFLNAFISNLTPLIVAILILYSMLFLPLSVNIDTVLGVCVSVFFVVVFTHISIRNTIAIDEVFYLEYFFFVVYFIIIIIPVNAFRDLLEVPSKFFEYNDAILPKILFWPIVLTIFYGITAWTFY